MRKKALKKQTAWLVVICMLAGMLVTVGQTQVVYAEAATAPWAGSGTAGEPYLINTAEDLAAISNAVYVEYLKAHFRQTVDIDLSNYTNWVPIGYDMANQFTGTYDGGGHTISNLTINNVSLDSVGLFGIVSYAGTLENIRLEGANISSSKSRTDVGSLVGRNYGTVSRNISSQVNVVSLSVYGHVGGLVGLSCRTVNDSHSSGSVNADGAYIRLGGLMGYNEGSLSNSYSTCRVTSSRTEYMQFMGGLVGQNFSYLGTVTNSYYDSETSEQSDTGKGTPKNTAEMMQFATFAGWDFENTWKITEGVSYPALQWELPWTADYEITVDSNELTWDDIKGNNNDEYSITEDLTLPTAGDNGTTISWSAISWVPNMINTVTGEVSRPTLNDGNQGVTLTATISKEGGTSQQKEFYLTVMAFDAQTEADIISDTAALTWDSIKGENGEIDNVTGNLVNPLPVRGASDTTISWSVTPTGWVNTYTGLVRRPSSSEGDKTVVLTATVNKGDYVLTQTKNFTLKIKMSDWSWQGEGSQENPYQVESAEQLNEVRYKMLENGGAVYFIQTADIDLTTYNNWIPIGNFTGNYNGNGFIISNLKISSDIENVGLFGTVEAQGSLENIKLENVDISSSGDYIGGLVGSNNGTVSNSSSSGNVVGLSEYSAVGGLVGYNDAWDGDGTIEYSYSTAKVTGGDSAYVGGLVGDNYGPIGNSYSTGEVTGGNSAYVGGLIGYFDSTIDTSYSTGKVTGGEGALIGGLVGENYEGTIRDSYYDSETSGQSDIDKGTPKTSAEMKQQATFITIDPSGTWDFANTWRIINGYTYPNLQWVNRSAEEINAMITIDKDALTWESIKGTNSVADNVTENLNLIASGANDTTITWSANPTGFINTSNGAVTRPSYSQGDKGVTLTATLSRTGGTNQVKDFTLTVKAQASTGNRGSSSKSISNAAVKGVSSITNIPFTIDNKAGSVMVNLEQTMAEALFGGEGNTGITVPSLPGVNTFTLEMPASVLAGGQAAGGALTFSTDKGSITISDNMLTGVAGVGGKEAGITIGQGDKSLLPDNVKEALGGRPLVQLTLTVDGQPREWNNPGAPVTVSIPYTPTSAELQNPEYIVIWYIDGAGNAVLVPSGKYDPATGTVTFTTTHFSHYTVAYSHRTFDDLGRAAWAKKPIEVMASKGIINGTGKENYSPAADITRADYLILLVKTLGLTAKFDSNFADVEQGDYYYDALGIAKKMGIVAGSGNNRFYPKEKISRQDMMVMTLRAMEKFKELEHAGTSTVLDKFRDKGNIADYAVESAAVLVRAGLIAGTDYMINPREKTTRAEAAVLLYGIYNY